MVSSSMNNSSELLWSPANGGKSTAMYGFMEHIERKYNIKLGTYDELHKWSIDNIGLLWKEVMEYCDVRIHKRGQVVLDEQVPMDAIPPWFPGTELNYAENVLQFTGSQPAIQYVSECNDEVRSISRDQLRQKVVVAISGLRALGVGKGDVVAAFAPNVPEVIFVVLAAAAIGATFTTASADFGVDSVLDRFSQVSPKVMFVGNAAPYNGKIHDQLGKVIAVLNELQSVSKCIVIDSVPGYNSDVELPDKCISYGDFEGLTARNTLQFESLPFDHPLYIMFSSGTTGKPKCIVHGAGRVLLKHLEEHKLQLDVREGDKMLQFTLIGWMMWQWMVSALALGACIVLYDGSPVKPDILKIWRLIEALKITHLGTSPKYLHTVKDSISKPIEQDLSTLRVITSTGSVLPADLFRFVYKHVKKDVMVASISGGTDILACFVGGCPILPVHAGEVQCAFLGMAVEVWNDEGRLVSDEPGELVCTKPFISMPVYFGGDVDGVMYRKAYFSRFPHIWHHGDFVIRNSKTGGFVMLGRSDGTLNPSGVRFGSAEIYSLVNHFDRIEDSLAISYKRPNDIDEKLVLFVKLKTGSIFDAVLVDELKKTIREHLSPRHVPAHIIECPDIPHTHNGKKIEVAVKRILSDMGDVSSMTSIANPESLDFYRMLAKTDTLYK